MKVIIAFLILFLVFTSKVKSHENSWWEVQSIDTMKYSRDLAREKLLDTSFDPIINRQVKDIAGTGANYIAIDTPYDEEFVPFLKRWVNQARLNGLHIWFRGNWSGWEGWFDYPRINREQHLTKTYQFIISHPDLFADGDIFDFCPECENGGPGDPRQTGDFSGHKQFLLDSRFFTQKAFEYIQKNVRSDINSMSGDLAFRLIDREMVETYDWTITLDHYVSNYHQLIADIDSFHQRTGGKVILGEIGLPIPQIHSHMTQEQRSVWLQNLLELLSLRKNYIIGLNYWVSVGGSTYLWDNDYQPQPIAYTLARFYKSTLPKPSPTPVFSKKEYSIWLWLLKYIINIMVLQS